MSRPTKHHRRRSRGERAVLVVAILLFVCAGLVGAWLCFARPPELDDPATNTSDTSDHQQGSNSNSGTDEEPVRQRRKNCFTILVSGHDDDNGGSDTNILVMVDPDQGEINAVSIPRDTLINTSWNIPKINAAYNVGGVERLCQELSNLLGIPVDYYVAVDLEGFVELVDAIGGVNFEVPVDMNYDDPTQNLHIHFSKGMQYLNGEDALKVLRWRQNNEPNSGYPNGDIGRIQTQQDFLITVARQMLSSLSLDMLNTYADLFVQYVDTELTVGNLVWLGQQLLTIGMDNVHFYTLPGEGQYLTTDDFWDGSYYVLDAQAALELVNDAFNPYDQPLTLEDMDILVPAS